MENQKSQDVLRELNLFLWIKEQIRRLGWLTDYSKIGWRHLTEKWLIKKLRLFSSTTNAKCIPKHNHIAVEVYKSGIYVTKHNFKVTTLRPRSYPKLQSKILFLSHKEVQCQDQWRNQMFCKMYWRQCEWLIESGTLLRWKWLWIVL